ncbi:MAG: 50S ribosomal protein L29 [bacterium]
MKNKVKTSDLRELSVDELKKKIAEGEKELLHLRIQKANQQLKNPLKVREVRRGIARLKTIIREAK